LIKKKNLNVNRLLSRFLLVDQINSGQSLPPFIFQLGSVYTPGGLGSTLTCWVGLVFLTMGFFFLFSISSFKIKSLLICAQLGWYLILRMSIFFFYGVKQKIILERTRLLNLVDPLRLFFNNVNVGHSGCLWTR